MKLDICIYQYKHTQFSRAVKDCPSIHLSALFCISIDQHYFVVLFQHLFLHCTVKTLIALYCILGGLAAMVNNFDDS